MNENQNSILLENVSGEIESKNLEINPPSLDSEDSDLQEDSIPKTTESEPAGHDMEPAAEISVKSDDTDKENGTENSQCDGAGQALETGEKEEDAESYSSPMAQGDKVQGLGEAKTTAKAADKPLEYAGETLADADDEQTSSNVDDSNGQEQPLDQSSEKAIEASDGKISALKVTASAVVIVVLFCGFFIFENKSKVNKNVTATETRESRAIFRNQKKQALTDIKPSTSGDNELYNTELQEITTLRDTLLGKQEEVQRLKSQYRQGIEDVEKEISDALQKGEINTFQQAMENQSIAFALQTIQRRQVYIEQLERPSKWILSACEELLYIKRRTELDRQVAKIAGGVDMNKHIQQIEAAVRKYQPTADRLVLDTDTIELEPLEAIWKRILAKTRQDTSLQPHSRNQVISDQICKGNFGNLSEISYISPETAKCIKEMRGSDLFLNGLSEISPAAARQLFQWNGSWICMNGVRALSPRVAHYLFRWDGNWISLNGLTEFPAEIGKTLLQWKGHQLELMGLQYIEDFPERISVEYLAQWERAGGKLFVTKSVRKKIDKLYPEPAGSKP